MYTPSRALTGGLKKAPVLPQQSTPALYPLTQPTNHTKLRVLKCKMHLLRFLPGRLAPSVLSVVNPHFISTGLPIRPPGLPTLLDLHSSICRPLFDAMSDIDVLSKVFAVLGTPGSESNWPAAKKLPYFLQFTETKPLPLRQVFPSVRCNSPSSAELIYPW